MNAYAKRVAHCRGSDEGLAALVTANPALDHLTVAWCDALTRLPPLDSVGHVDASHCVGLAGALDVHAPALHALALGHCPLEALTLRHCPMLSTLLLPYCTRLERLECLAPLARAAHLSLVACRAPVAVAAHFPHLVQLDATAAPVVCRALPATLRTLVLDDCPALPPALSALTRLSVLSLCRVAADSAAFPALPHLATLLAHECRAVPPVAHMPALTCLDLSFSSAVGPELLDALPPALVTLRVYGCPALSAASVARLVAARPELAVHHNADD